MRVLHHLEALPSVSVGGVELYVETLARLGGQFGFDGALAGCARDGATGELRRDGLPMFGYRHDLSGDHVSHWSRPPPAFPQFLDWFKRNRFDVYHLHSWNSHCNLHHVRAARALGVPVVLTTHEVLWVCVRKSMMYLGTGLCDGVFNVSRCSQCRGWGAGVPGWMREAIASTPSSLAAGITEHLLPREFGLRLGRLRVLNLRTRGFVRASTQAHAVVSVSRWLRDVLTANGVAAHSVRHVAHGISALPPDDLPPPPSGRVLEVGFLGRFDEAKGIRVLFAAMQALPREVPVRFRIFGFAAAPWEKAIEQEMAEAGRIGDRIVFEGAVDRQQVWRVLRSLDVLAVPSQIFESGPLVVREAHAVGTPVLGSGFGGIAEQVRDGVDGWLIPAPQCLHASSWTDAIARLAADPDRVRAARARMGPPRTMHDVAREMAAIYDEAVRSRNR